MQYRRINLFIVVPLLAAGVACSPSRQPAPRPATAASSPAEVVALPSLTARAVAEQSALIAYMRMWQAYEKAATVPNAGDPALARHADGRALELVTRALKFYTATGLRGRGSTVLSPRVASVTPADVPTQARVEDCMDTSGTHLFKIDGSAYPDAAGGRRRMIATVAVVAPETWKVVSFGLGEVGSC